MQIEFLVAAVVGFFAGFAAAVLWLRQRALQVDASSTASPAGTEPGTTVDLPAAGESDWLQELGAVADTIEVGIVRLGPRLEVMRLNRAASRMLRTDANRIAGRSVMEIFVDHRVEEGARTALREGSASYEVSLRGDEERRAVLRFRPAPSGGVWLLIEDVTELRRLQRIRSEFIDNLSHELRTPLTTIRLLTETLSQDVARPGVEVPEQVRERILKIDVETGHLAQMVNELLDLSRIEGGAAELHLENVRISDVIGAAVERLRTFADRQLVGLDVDLPEPGLPPVLGDEERLGQVMVNLLHNAIKFSPAESVVTVSADVSDGMVAVRVRDQGVGVADADLDRIFERFYKVDKARQRGQGGTGLGLAIARHIVEGHGGRIWAQSVEGSGSTFTFTVPVAGA